MRPDLNFIYVKKNIGCEKMNEELLKFIVKLQDNEKEVAELYGQYGAIFKEDAEIWNSLREEELMHAQILYDIKRKFEDNNLTIAKPVSPKAILLVNSSIGFIKKQISKADPDNITVEQALRTGMRIEESLFEENIFSMFYGINNEIDKQLDELLKDTRKHHGTFQELLKERGIAPPS
jgi:hypothetical protein